MRETIVSGVSCAPTARRQPPFPHPTWHSQKVCVLRFPQGIRSSDTSRRTTQELRSCLRNGSTCGNKLRTSYLTGSGLSRPGVFLQADFSYSHASRSRESPFERVNLRRAVRHFRRRTDNWSFHQYIESQNSLFVLQNRCSEPKIAKIGNFLNTFSDFILKISVLW